MCVGRWFDALEVNIVESVVSVTRARHIFGGEDCRETVVTNLTYGDQVVVT